MAEVEDAMKRAASNYRDGRATGFDAIAAYRGFAGLRPRLGSPLGVTALDAVAAMTFIVFVVTLSVQNLFERSEPVAV